MRLHRNAFVCLAAAAALTLIAADSAGAQRIYSRGNSPNIAAGPVRGGGGYRGGGWGATIPGVLLAIPQMAPPDEVYIEDEDGPRGPRRARQSAGRRTTSRTPSANARYVPDEVVIEIPNSATAQQIDALQRRHRLTRIESQTFALTGTTLYRWRIPDRRSVAAVVRTLRNDRLVAAVQPNYLFALQRDAAKTEGARAKATRPKETRRNMNSPNCICRRRIRSPKATECWWRCSIRASTRNIRNSPALSRKPTTPCRAR